MLEVFCSFFEALSSPLLCISYAMDLPTFQASVSSRVLQDLSADKMKAVLC